MKLFRFFLILTFIGSGLCCFSYLMLGLCPEAFQQVVNSPEQQTLLDDATKALLKSFLFIPSWQFFLLALFYAISFTGAVFMWLKKRIGLFLYIFAQVILVIMPKLIFGFPMDVGDAMITLLFVAVYYWAFKTMEEENNEAYQFQDNDDDDDDADNDDDDDDEEEENNSNVRSDDNDEDDDNDNDEDDDNDNDEDDDEEDDDEKTK